VRAVRLGHLVVQPGPPAGQVHDVHVPQSAAAVRRGDGRPGAWRRGRDQRGRVGADGDAGPFLVVLRRAGPAVVVGRDRLPGETDRGDPGAAGVPLPGPAGERGALPDPVEPVRAGRVLGRHLVGFQRVGERVDGRPHVPAAVAVLHDGVFDRAFHHVAGEHHVAVPDVELGRVGGLGDLDPPVFRAGGGAAQVQPPAAVRQPDELRALQRLGVHLFLGDHHDRSAEVHPVSRERDRHGVAPAAADRPPQPVSEVNAVVGEDRRRPPGPVSGTGTGRNYREDRIPWPGQKHIVIVMAIYHIGIIDNLATTRNRTRRHAFDEAGTTRSYA